MRRIRREVLLRQRVEGGTIWVFEVDLVELGPDRFMVNIWYGQQGTTLEEGTRTVRPVTRARAETILNDLLAEKASQGYVPEGVAPSLQRAQATTLVSGSSRRAHTNDDWSHPPGTRERAILERLARARSPQSSRGDADWKISRVVWRAGLLRLVEAESLIRDLIGLDNPMLDYSAAWALGRLRQPESAPALAALAAPEESPLDDRDDSPRHGSSMPAYVRRIAYAAWLECLSPDERQHVRRRMIDALPATLAQALHDGDHGAFEHTLDNLLSKDDPAQASILEDLYLIDGPKIRPSLLKHLGSIPLKPPHFRQVRAIYKQAEMRGEPEVLGLLARRFDRELHNSSVPSITVRGARADELDTSEESPIDHPSTTNGRPQRAYAHRTRNHLRRRSWRTLKALGDLSHPDYVRLAAGHLAAIVDDDARSPQPIVRYEYQDIQPSTDRGLRFFGIWIRWPRPALPRLEAIPSHIDCYGHLWVFNNILYGNSPRYQPNPRSLQFQCAGGYEPSDQAPTSREESYPKLWTRAPETLFNLLQVSRCEEVHRFAVKVLRDRPDYLRRLPTEGLVALLDAPYVITAQLGLELALERHDPDGPDPVIVLALANSVHIDAREQAFRWIREHSSTLLSRPEFASALILSRQPKTREFAILTLVAFPLTPEQSRAVIGRVIAELLTMGEVEAHRVSGSADALREIFRSELREIGPEVIADLLDHRLIALQQLAGDLVLDHQSLSDNPPAAILLGLLGADDPRVRAIGVRIIARINPQRLAGETDLLVALIRHPLPDIRDGVRPVVRRLVESTPELGGDVTMGLVRALLIPGAPEGVPSATARILREDLRQHLDVIPEEIVWTLLASRSRPAQEIGALLLSKYVDKRLIEVSMIVRLGNHELVDVRESALAICRDQADRVLDQLDDALPMLDARWDDTRRFAREFFQDRVSGPLWTVPRLAALCDSPRPDVQRFAQDMILRHFRDEDGPELLEQLAEHPEASVQQFVSQLLDRYARNDPERLRRLVPYFRTVLARVNRGRVARRRVLDLLETEAMTDRSSAEIVAEVLTWHSATSAIGDKARALEILLAIQERHPRIHVPLVRVPEEIRGAV